MRDEDAALVKRYLRGECTPEETAKVEAWYNQRLKQRAGLQGEADYARHFVESFEIIQQTKKATPVKRIRWLPYAAAVLIFALVGTGLFFGDKIINRQSNIVNLQSVDIAPGGNRATLTLADGRTIDLNQVQTGITINDENVVYNDGSQEIVSLQSATVHNLTLTTPKGGTYSITLADGTKVWLNANSTLRYPSTFSDDERVVELEGEGYFDVASDRNKPFKVMSNGQEVVVLGTQFNIAAYPDDQAIKTTLVEGAVNLRTGAADMRLAPGEQGITHNGILSKSAVDLEAAIAWKNGLFAFNNNLRHTLAQISRWYDVVIEYQDPIDQDFTLIGKVSRNMKLGSLLGYIEEASGNHVSFTLKERRIIVRKYPKE